MTAYEEKARVIASRQAAGQTAERELFVEFYAAH